MFYFSFVSVLFQFYFSCMSMLTRSFKTILFQPKQNAKPAAKHSCFSQSLPVSAVYAKLLSIMSSGRLGAQTVDIDCECLKYNVTRLF